MTNLAFAPLVFSLLLTGCAAASTPATSCPSLESVPTILRTLHDLDWANASAAEVQRVIKLPWERIEAEIPSESQYAIGACTGSTYLKFESGACSISLEFRKQRSPNGCLDSLYAVRADFSGSAHAVAAAQAMTVASLRATGMVCDEDQHYRWRSEDSSTLNDLTLATTNEAGEDRLSLSLTHRLVPPEVIDGLPFPKGFFPATSRSRVE